MPSERSFAQQHNKHEVPWNTTTANKKNLMFFFHLKKEIYHSFFVMPYSCQNHNEFEIFWVEVSFKVTFS
jgi:hypothetical protein